MILIRDLTSFLESLFPIAYQEDYDNCGLITGRFDKEVTGIIVCLNVTEDVIHEALDRNCNCIISHHPMIFRGLKKLTSAGKSEIHTELCIKNNLAVYALHTNADKGFSGLNSFIAAKMGLKNVRVLAPEKGILKKLVTFCPVDHAESVRNAIFDAGGGVIGEYDSCSFNCEGAGTFRGSAVSNPFVGNKGEVHSESEIRIEIIFPSCLQKKVILSLLQHHPYEEVAYDVYSLDNEHPRIGLGALGELEKPLKKLEFLQTVKQVFGTQMLKYSGDHNSKIRTVAVCGGSGSGLISKASASGADAYITSDVKYHEFENGSENFLLIDAGHYETEIFFREFILDKLNKKFTNFAIHFSEREKNHYYYF